MAADIDNDGDSHFLRGMNSQNDPMQLPAGFYRTSMNTTNRGGMVQTRPGYNWKFNMPSGVLQGGCLFRSADGFEQLIFAVAGSVYASSYPFTEYQQLTTLSFRDDVPDVFFCATEKAVQRNDDESIRLIRPYKLLVIQDGFTRPAVWDGTTARHTDPGLKEIPVGTHMSWSGNRLWVARRQEIFVGDINDPVSFREGTYLSNAKSFLLDKVCTGMAEITSNGSNAGQLVAFTDTSTSLFKSGIRQRTKWETTDDFQSILLPGIGCVAHRSIITQYGLLWWYSQFGLINLNSALSTYVSSEFEYRDLEMAVSKGYLAPGIDGIACAAFENYILTSVPYADLYNTHTWVLDNSPSDTINEETPKAWNSYWTGTRPRAWAFGPVQGVERIFQFSVDLDGINRVWEAFSNERTDNGCPIISTIETRAYTKGTIVPKEYRFSEVALIELQGRVDVGIFWAGASRGAFKKITLKEIAADEGIIDDERVIDEPTSQFYGFKKQSRLVRTVDVKTSPQEKTTCQIESPDAERIDTAFQHLIVWTGPAAIRSIRVFFTPVKESTSGKCEPDETGLRAVRFDGSGTSEESELVSVPTVFTSNKTFNIETGELSYVGLGYGESILSQSDADRIALSHAKNQADIWFSQNVAPHDGNPDDPEV